MAVPYPVTSQNDQGMDRTIGTHNTNLSQGTHQEMYDFPGLDQPPMFAGLNNGCYGTMPPQTVPFFDPTAQQQHVSSMYQFGPHWGYPNHPFAPVPPSGTHGQRTVRAAAGSQTAGASLQPTSMNPRDLMPYGASNAIFNNDDLDSNCQPATPLVPQDQTTEQPNAWEQHFRGLTHRPIQQASYNRGPGFGAHNAADSTLQQPSQPLQRVPVHNAAPQFMPGPSALTTPVHDAQVPPAKAPSTPRKRRTSPTASSSATPKRTKTAPSERSPTASAKRSCRQFSCEACKSSKVKCDWDPTSDSCSKCRKKGKHCVVKKSDKRSTVTKSNDLQRLVINASADIHDCEKLNYLLMSDINAAAAAEACRHLVNHKLSLNTIIEILGGSHPGWAQSFPVLGDYAVLRRATRMMQDGLVYDEDQFKKIYKLNEVRDMELELREWSETLIRDLTEELRSQAAQRNVPTPQSHQLPLHTSSGDDKSPIDQQGMNFQVYQSLSPFINLTSEVPHEFGMDLAGQSNPNATMYQSTPSDMDPGLDEPIESGVSLVESHDTTIPQIPQLSADESTGGSSATNSLSSDWGEDCDAAKSPNELPGSEAWIFDDQAFMDIMKDVDEPWEEAQKGTHLVSEE